jgi:hypothetical protein
MARFAFFTPGNDANKHTYDDKESIEVSVDFPSRRDGPLKTPGISMTSPTISVSSSASSEEPSRDDQIEEQSYIESSGSEESNHDGRSVEQSYSESSESVQTSVQTSHYDDTSMLQSFSEGGDSQEKEIHSSASEIDDMTGGGYEKLMPTAETFMNTFSHSRTQSGCQDDTDFEKSAYSSEDAIVKQESRDRNENTHTKRQSEGVVDDETEVGDLRVDCVVQVSGSASISAMDSSDGLENLGSSGRLVPTGDKLAMMMRDRIQAINCIRDLLDSESSKGKSC